MGCSDHLLLLSVVLARAEPVGADARSMLGDSRPSTLLSSGRR